MPFNTVRQPRQSQRDSTGDCLALRAMRVIEFLAAVAEESKRLMMWKAYGSSSKPMATEDIIVHPFSARE